MYAVVQQHSAVLVYYLHSVTTAYGYLEDDLLSYRNSPCWLVVLMPFYTPLQKHAWILACL